MNWNNFDSCYYKLHISKKCNKICAFDFDDTLVKMFTSDPLPNLIDIINTILLTNNVVVFSNQKGITTGKNTHERVQFLMDTFSQNFDNKISFLYAIDDDEYRKPFSAMFHLFNHLTNHTQQFQYYCGDAAGRPTDFNISDLYFANNIGIIFKLPEEVFLSDTSKNNTIATTTKKTITNSLYKDDVWKNGILQNPRNIINIANPNTFDYNFESLNQYLILMVGPQGSGKSTLSLYLKNKYNFDILNNDTIKSKAKAKKEFEKLYNNSSTNGIIIDNTNPKLSTRQEWLEKNTNNWDIIIIFIDIEKDVSKHCVNYRLHHGHDKIPSIAINIYYKNLEKPTANEGHIIRYENVFHHSSYDHNLRFV